MRHPAPGVNTWLLTAVLNDKCAPLGNVPIIDWELMEGIINRRVALGVRRTAEWEASRALHWFNKKAIEDELRVP